MKRSRLRLGRGCGECEECRKKRPTFSRHHHSSSRGLVLPLLSSPYNHFQAFQSSTVVTGWEASERSGPDQTTGDDDRRRKVGRFLSPRRLFPYRSLPSHLRAAGRSREAALRDPNETEEREVSGETVKRRPRRRRPLGGFVTHFGRSEPHPCGASRVE